jgi:hypothetical protein
VTPEVELLRFRTFLIAEQVEVGSMTARDIANRVEKYDLIHDAQTWAGLVRLRNRLSHEYPVSPTEQLERVCDARDAVPLLRSIRDKVASGIRARGYSL